MNQVIEYEPVKPRRTGPNPLWYLLIVGLFVYLFAAGQQQEARNKERAAQARAAKVQQARDAAVLQRLNDIRDDQERAKWEADQAKRRKELGIPEPGR